MPDRIHSIDSMRLIAIGFVVMVHTDPFQGLGVYGNLANFVIDTTARFAVPFFFMASGYFFANGLRKHDSTEYVKARVRTVLSIYGFGLLLAVPGFLSLTAIGAGLSNQDVTQAVTDQLLEFASPLHLLYYGDSVSEILWFLVALAYSYVLIYLFVRRGRTRYLLPAAAALHVVGLMGQGYTMFIDVPFPTRDGLFFGFFYTSLGYYLSTTNWRPPERHSRLYLGATIIGFGLQLGERYLLGYELHGMTFTQGVYEPEYTIGTVFVTLSLFLFLLSRPELFRTTSLPNWGRDYAIGIYVIHGGLLVFQHIAIEISSYVPYAITNMLIWHLVFTPITFFGSILVYRLLHRLGIVERGDFRPTGLRKHFSWL